MAETAFLTVLIGVLVLVVGQVVIRFVLEPLQDQRKTIAEIGAALIVYANVYANVESLKSAGNPRADDLRFEAERRFRFLASQMRAQTAMVPAYRLIAWVFRLPSRPDVYAASKSIIGLSNASLGGASGMMTDQWAREARMLLRISEE